MADAKTEELTARGRGAIAVVQVCGSDAIEVVQKCFASASGKPLRELASRQIVYGTWKSTGEDLVVVSVADDQLEVHCHGGTAVVEVVKQDLSDAGAGASNSQPPSPAAYAADVADVIQGCGTQRSAMHLLNMYESWKQIDAGESVSAATAGDALRFVEFGRHLDKPWKVVLCGPPNAGKSSLINAICGFERAIVHTTAGTTRDVIQQQTAIDGWPVQFSDTAGIRETDHEIESAGVARAKKTIQDSDLVAFVFDIQTEVSEIREFLDSTRDLVSGDSVLVFNKLDLVSESEIENLRQVFDSHSTIFLSCAQQTGLDDFQAELSQQLVPELPRRDLPVPVCERQIDFLKSVRD